MATVGQVVYNLRDFHPGGGFISTSKVDLWGTVSFDGDLNDPDKYDIYDAARLQIFGEGNDLVKKFSASAFSKLGIQAPPGTKVWLNGKPILIGRTGVYELDDDIRITQLWFEEPKNYEIDEDATKNSLDAGIKGFEEAEKQRADELDKLNSKYENKEKDTDYWTEYTTIQDKYDKIYKDAENSYIAGINGIYVLSSDADKKYRDLYNVIVDFIY